MLKFFIATFLLSVYCCADIFQQTNNPLGAVQVNLVQQQYKSAKLNLSEYLKKNPSDIEALYLSLAIDQTESLDYESYNIEGKNFLVTAENVKNSIEKTITTLRGKDSIMGLFYLANVYGGMSVIQAKTGSWMDGVKNGMTSVNLLKQVQKMLPDFYAAYLGIGVFNYYFSSSLNWLPFAHGKWQEGLSYIEIALKSGLPFNYAAKNSLCWILIERKEYERAVEIASSVLRDCPSNTIFLRIKAIANLRKGNYQEAIEYATKLLSLAKERDPLNWSDVVAAYYILVESYYHSGMNNESRTAAETILNTSIPKVCLSVPHIKKNLKCIKDIRDTIGTIKE
jgi:tetratricopeptide (TPR) repeat protein